MAETSHYKLNSVICEQTSQFSTAVYLKISEIVVLFDMSKLLKFMMGGIKKVSRSTGRITSQLHN